MKLPDRDFIGSDTVVIAMAKFKKREFSSDNKMITVGVGNTLEALSSEMEKRSVALPHGECPQVGIGGHAQTGKTSILAN